jgi:hypothetical protein
VSKFLPPRLRLIDQFLSVQEQFDQYFDREIKPLFENAVEVYESNYTKSGMWTPDVPLENRVSKALLINIQPIQPESVKPKTIEEIGRELIKMIDEHCNKPRTVKIVEQESAEDILREFVAARNRHGLYLDDIYLKALKFLERKSNG